MPRQNNTDDADLLTLTSHYELSNFERNFTNALDDFKLSAYDMEELYEGGMLKRYTPRPVDTKECDNLENAKMWRFELIEDVSRRVELIQDESLQEFQIRQLNDKINALLTEKEAWETRIVELGGPDYKRLEPSKQFITTDTKDGYRYFGKAKELEGVKSLLQAQKEFDQLQQELESEIPVMPMDYYHSNPLELHLSKQYDDANKPANTQNGNLFGIYPEDVLFLHTLPHHKDIEQCLVALKKKELLNSL